MLPFKQPFSTSLTLSHCLGEVGLGFLFSPESTWKGAGVGKPVMRLQPPFPLATCCPMEESHGQVVPCLPGADTNASGEDVITKRFIRRKSVKGMGLLTGTLVLGFSLFCLQSLFIDSFLSPLSASVGL